MGFHDEYLKRLFYRELTGPPKTFEQSVAYDIADRDNAPPRQSNENTGDNAEADISLVLNAKAVLCALGCCLVVFIGGLTLSTSFAGSPLGYLGLVVILISGILLAMLGFALMSHILFRSFRGIAYCFRQKWFLYGIAAATLIGIPGALIASGAFGAFILGVLAAFALYGNYKIRKGGSNGDEDGSV